MTDAPRRFRPSAGPSLLRGLATLALLLIAIPSRAAESAAAAPVDSARVPLRVAADTSLSDVLKALEPPYESAHPGTDLVFTFGPSGTLRAQIMQRLLKADVFICAGEEEVGALMIGGRVDAGASVPVATNRLMLVTGLRGRLSALTELRDTKIRRVAIGNPGTVPVGRVGVAALQKAGVWLAVKPRLRYCASSQEIVDVVARNEVDAGLVYASDALRNPQLKVVMGLDSFSGETRYVAVPIKDEAGRTDGGDFLIFLRTEAARARFTQFQFGKP